MDSNNGENTPSALNANANSLGGSDLPLNLPHHFLAAEPDCEIYTDLP